MFHSEFSLDDSEVYFFFSLFEMTDLGLIANGSKRFKRMRSVHIYI